MAKTILCASCTKGVYCPTWSEWKCLRKAVRFSNYGRPLPTKCEDYEKRGTNFKEPKCQCDSCLRNEALADEYEED